MKITITQGKENVSTTITFVAGDVTQLIKDANNIQELQIGIGKANEITDRGSIRLIRRIIFEAKRHGLTHVAIDLRSFRFQKARLAPALLLERIAYQLEIAQFEFDVYRTKKKDIRKNIEEVRLLGKPTKSLTTAIARGQLIAGEVNAARALANTPGGEMTPEVLARAAELAAKGTKVRVTVLGTKEMRTLKMGALLGVGSGSANQPRFIIMEYRGSTPKTPPTVLVGKGVTFDSGGINIKSTSGLEDMHLDMSGGAMVMHAIIAAAKLKLKKNVVALIPSVENMPSGASYRPGDILKSMSGKTIEIGNTDAEGRVIMADALTYAERYNPKMVIDVATLTGAAVVALGERVSAIFSNREKLIPRIQKFGDDIGDYVWPLPLWEEYDADFKAQFGDIANSNKSRYGGAITAARFLNHFAEKYPWVHIDMAPRMISIDGDYLAKGSTGEPTHLLVKVLERM